MTANDRPVGARQTLEQYARKRFALAGGALLAASNPYCVQVDRYKAECAAKDLNFLSFAHYDYLGLADDPRVCRAAHQALRDLGPGAGASRLVGGERAIHTELEQQLACFVGCEAALTLVSGYGTNLAIVGHLLTTGDLILVDEFAHNSILMGAKLSRATTLVFRHNDLEHLTFLLAAERCNYRRVLVIAEGLYSMDGDVPDLRDLIALKRVYDFWLMIDEAHSIGVLGATGRGVCEHFGIDPGDVDLIVGTLSKSLVACGGFVCAGEPVIEWLRYTLPGYVYSVGLPPAMAAAALAALNSIESEPERVRRLQGVSQCFKEQAHAHGFNVGSALGAGIVPIIMTGLDAAFHASESLLADGIYVPPVVQLGVPKDTPRLRFFLSAAHAPSDVDRALRVLAAWRSRSQGALDPNQRMASRV